MIDTSKIRLSEDRDFNSQEVIELYRLNKWSSADKPDKLINALKNSHTVIIAYYNDKVIGLGNSIADGFLVVYYPHLLINPDFQGYGIGKMIMDKFQNKYSDFHQQMLTADGKAIEFYKKCGFERAGQTEPMWIYQGDEH
jgi:ribosomal protein S18 acetylase RimI-like enzyme